MEGIKLVYVIVFALVPVVYPQSSCDMISRYEDFTACTSSIGGDLGSMMEDSQYAKCFQMMETVARCVEKQNHECGDDDQFSRLLNPRRIRDSGPSMCEHIDDIMQEMLCMESSGKMMEFMTCKAMVIKDMLQSRKNDKASMCRIFTQMADCIATGTQDCGFKYVGFMKSMFPSDEQCSRVVVSSHPHIAAPSKTDSMTADLLLLGLTMFISTKFAE